MSARADGCTAEVCANYGMRQVGGWGIRGWRVWCGRCDFLSQLYTHIRSAQSVAHKHRCDEPLESP